MKITVGGGCILILLVLAPGWHGIVAVETSLQLIEDTSIRLDTSIYHKFAHLQTYTWPAGQLANAAIVRFDVGTLPLGVSIIHATLSLYLQDWRGSEPYHVTIHRIKNVNPSVHSATGYTYDGVNNWTANNCCYNGIPLAQADIAPASHFLSVPESTGYNHWHVTSIVQFWVNNPGSAFGMLVNGSHASAVGDYRFFSSFEGYSDRWPQLVVGYDSLPPPPPNTSTDRSVTLQWLDNSHNEVGFYVERRQFPPSGSFTRVAQVEPNVTEWEDIFSSVEERCYRVQAFNVHGASFYTSEACACRNFVCRPSATTPPAVTDRPPATSRPPVP